MPRFGRLFPVNVGAPMVLTQLAAAAAGRAPRADREHHERCGNGGVSGLGTVRRNQGGARAADAHARGRTARPGRVGRARGPGRHAHAHASGSVSGEDISDRPLPEVTVPFWNWLFDQDPEAIRGQRFAAQQEDARWLQQA